MIDKQPNSVERGKYFVGIAAYEFEMESQHKTRCVAVEHSRKWTIDLNLFPILPTDRVFTFSRPNEFPHSVLCVLTYKPDKSRCYDRHLDGRNIQTNIDVSLNSTCTYVLSYERRFLKSKFPNFGTKVFEICPYSEAYNKWTILWIFSTNYEHSLFFTSEKIGPTYYVKRLKDSLTFCSKIDDGALCHSEDESAIAQGSQNGFVNSGNLYLIDGNWFLMLNVDQLMQQFTESHLPYFSLNYTVFPLLDLVCGEKDLSVSSFLSLGIVLLIVGIFLTLAAIIMFKSKGPNWKKFPKPDSFRKLIKFPNLKNRQRRRLQRGRFESIQDSST